MVTSADLDAVVRRLDMVSQYLEAIVSVLPAAQRTWLTPAEAAKLTGVTTRTLQNHIASGRITRAAYKREPRGTGFTYRYHRELVMHDLGLA